MFNEYASRSLAITILALGMFAAVGVVTSLRAEPTHEPTTQPAADSQKKADSSSEMDPPREPSPAEILKELSKDANAPARMVAPSRPGVTQRSTVEAGALPPNAIAPVQPRLFPDGYRLVDRPGRLTREGDYYTFAFESRGQGAPELPIRLLPNRLLEDMEVASAGGSKPVVFIVSGELTEYHGANYLLVQKLLTKPNLGNLK